MQSGKKVVCVLPAHNAARTLERTLEDVPPGIVELFILVDDFSRDDTLAVAQQLATRFPLQILSHDVNRGYGANQKTCYRAALESGKKCAVYGCWKSPFPRQRLGPPQRHADLFNPFVMITLILLMLAVFAWNWIRFHNL